VNPNVDARTHAKIATGTTETKFGIDLDHAADAAKAAAAMPGIDFLGLAVHIGSQLTEMAPFRAAFERVVGLALALRGAGVPIRRLDLGGGLGVDYGEGAAPRLDAYARIVRETTAPLACPLIFEPGRALVAEAGVLVTRVLYVKRGASRTFVIVDAAMNDFIRPTLYGAHHAIVPVAEPAAEVEAHRVDVVGPVCETGDMFAEQRPLPPLAPGDLLAILGTGAYGSVMASSYNTRPPAAEVMVNGADVAVIRPRRTVADLIADDRLPDWLNGAAAEAAVVARPRRR
jgi:diaminopimelate decarboxylase